MIYPLTLSAAFAAVGIATDQWALAAIGLVGGLLIQVAATRSRKPLG
jgi:hypothetical protein